MIVSANAHARQIQNTATKLGCDLPEQFTATLTAAQKLTEAAAQFDGVAGKLNARAISLLLAGKNPVDDTEVKRLATSRVLSDSGIRVAGAEHANHLVADAIEQHADAITAAWSAALEPDYTALHRAAEQLDLEDLSTGDVAALTRRNLVDVWPRAVTANNRVAVAAGGVGAIRAATGQPHRREHRVLLLADVGLEQAEAISSVANTPTPWVIARAGAQVKLVTVTEFRQRVTEYNDAQAERQRRLAESRRPDGFDGHRRQAATI